jgi:glycosyltransferase involved in cell wall biosynthesis
MVSSNSVDAGDGRPSISVAMATYNGETYLPEMLETLTRQTRLPDELVVRDDGSSDRTLRVVEEFAAGAPFPVRVLAGGERLGYAQNFVAASNACFGDVVFFADQDDGWRPPKLETVSRAMDPGKSQAVFHDFALQGPDGTQIAPSFYALLAERGFGTGVAIKGCSMAVTRAFLDAWGWPPAATTISHDFWVALISTAFGQRGTLDDILIDHRLHSDNASGWIPDDSARAFTVRGDLSSDVELLIDLVIKKRRIGRWTPALVELADGRGARADPEAALALRRSLRANRRHHRQARV